MKKLLVLILALVMMMSLTACGGEKIEITTENWRDYLEIRQEFATIDKLDAFGNVDGERVTNFTMLCLKEEYADRVASDSTDLTFTFMATNVFYEYSIEDGKIIKGEVAAYEPMDKVETITDETYLASDDETEQMLVDEYDKVVLLPTFDVEEAVGILENIVIGKFEGTLVLE
ncbi:MAG: hypothetical protein IKT62_06240 [Firmicutes bacterium]|nr:hypothetical protein [Bacillota bacterium]